MGLDGIEAVLRGHGHGPQRDDQTALLVRIGGRAGDNT
jgi:hypothetical protein